MNCDCDQKGGFNWELSRLLASRTSDNIVLDEQVSKNLCTHNIYWHNSTIRYYTQNSESFPKIKQKVDTIINDIIDSYVNRQPCVDKYQLSRIIMDNKDYLKDETIDKCIKWKKDFFVEYNFFIARLVRKPKDALLVIQDIVKEYDINSNKKYLIPYIDEVFVKLDKDHTDEGCKLLASKTPAIRACMLINPNISDKYILIGLKALGKLKRSRFINVKIDPECLKKLAPKTRMRCVRHMLENYSRVFKTFPTEDEMRLLLFPCFSDHYSEVQKLLNNYKRIIMNNS